LSTRYHSGIKAKRQNETHKAHNKAEMSKIRTQVKKTRALAAVGKQDEAAALMPEMFSVLDKGVKHGRLHKNTAARRKSRIAKKLALTAKA
jgi:small subunit ribosomal protein S20